MIIFVTALKDAQLKFVCEECDKRFRTAVQLQLHLVTHDSVDESMPLEQLADSDAKSRRSVAATARWRRLKATKKAKDAGEESGKFQSWKKKKTHLYLNRYNLLLIYCYFYLRRYGFFFLLFVSSSK